MLEALEVDYPAEEKRIHAALKRVRRAAGGDGTGDHAEKFATDFVLMTLKKRLFSSPAAFLRTLEQHETSRSRNAKSGRAVSKPTRGILQRQIDRVDEDYSVDDEADEATPRPSTPPAAVPRAVARGGGAAQGDEGVGGTGDGSQLDAKVRELIRWLNETHPAGDAEQVVRRAGHHLHRVPGHAELAARRPRRRGASPATTGC